MSDLSASAFGHSASTQARQMPPIYGLVMVLAALLFGTLVTEFDFTFELAYCLVLSSVVLAILAAYWASVWWRGKR